MAEELDSEIPDWFWELLDSCKPNLQALASKLEALSRERLVAYAATYERAAEDLCDYWSGPIVDGEQLSVDDTEDLCHWIVSQGSDVYAQALALKGQIEPFWPHYRASETGEDPDFPRWSVDVENEAYKGFQSPAGIPHPIFEARFGSSLWDEIE